MAPPATTQTTTLKRHAHTPEELLEFIWQESTRRGSDLTEKQRNALSRCYSTSEDLSGITPETFIQNMLTVFDDLFFCSSLASITTIHYKLKTSTESGKRGETNGFWHPFHKVVIRFWVRGSKEGENLSHTKLLWKYAGTLLHEMVHGYIGYYLSFKYGYLHLGSLECCGKTGHGYLFQDIAHIVEMAFADLTKKTLSLGRQKAFWSELSRWKHGSCQVDVVKRWGFSMTH